MAMIFTTYYKISKRSINNRKSSLSTTRHLHSGGRHSSSSFDSQSQSVHSCDSGFSDKRRASLSDIKSTGHPSYYPLFAHVLHRQKNCSDFPSNLSLVISDFEHGHSEGD